MATGSREIDDLNKRLVSKASRITTHMVLEARKDRNWKVFDMLEPIDKLKLQIAELNNFIIRNRK